MPKVETSGPEAVLETIFGFASTPVAEWDVPRFEQVWAGVDQDLPKALLRLQQPIDQILGFRSLPPNWDSYGSRPVEDRAIACGLVLLLQAEAENAGAPHVCPVPGGGVQLEWQAGQRALELEALPDGSAQFLRVDGQTMDEGPLDPNEPAGLRSLLRWLRAGR